MILNYNKIELELESNKRWCNIFKDWHYDNNFYFIIKMSNYKYYIYNYCITCQTDEVIDISTNKEFNEFIINN